MPRKRGGQQEFGDFRKGVMKYIQQEKTVEQRENIPEIACGKCKHFRDSGSMGSGTCGILKTGTELWSDPPVFVTEGGAPLLTMFNMNSSWCPHYEEMELVDTDISQSHDPRFSRHQRQMHKK